jgi:peptidoglycan/LPS O-acetylase OafA/YrhL
LAVFGPSRWIAFGPLAIQASRIGLYAACFATGVAVGPTGVASFRDALARGWPGWVLLAGLTGAILVSRVPIGYGIVLPTFCAAACFAVSAVFLRFAGRPNRIWDGLAASSYAIYLLHYPVVTWIQYCLLAAPAGAIAKAGITFTATLSLSWIAAALLRRIPGFSRVIA